MARSVLSTEGNANRRESGFTLIEVMFASVYLSVGLLAIAAMQDMALSRLTDSKRLSIATNATAEMLERIRFNSPANATLASGVYPYNGIRVCNFAATTAANTGASANCGTGGESAGNTGAATTVAYGDYDQWRARIKATDPSGAFLLPDAVGTVTSTATGSSGLGQVQVTVTLSWTAGIRRPTITVSTFVAPL